jgi:hypothetical protein
MTISECKMHLLQSKIPQSINSFSIVQKPKSKVSSQILGKYLTVSPCKLKNKLHISNIQWHRVNIPIPKGRNRSIARKDWINTNQNSTGLQGSWPCHPLPGFLGFLLKSHGKPPWPHSACLQNQHHMDNAKVCHQLEQCQAPLDHDCSDLWVLLSFWEKLNPRNTSLGCPVQAGLPAGLSSRESLSNEFTTLCTEACDNVGSGQFLRCPQVIFPIVSLQSAWFLFNGHELFTLQVNSISHKFSGTDKI